MHSQYLFLFQTDPGATEEDISDQAMGIINEYSNDHCDENNWWQEEAVITRAGDVIQLCPMDDWRGRNGVADEFIELPKSERWQAVMKFALNMAGYSLKVNLDETSDLDKAAKDARTKAAALLLQEKDSDMALWQARNIMEAINSTQSADQYPPFSDNINDPYHEWNCYNMVECGEEIDEERLAVLFVDIHT